MSRPVFCHYMVGGMGNISQAEIDVREAKTMGFDAFALNVISADPWSMAALAFLFQAAAALSFKLFLSFDMNNFRTPDDFLPILEKYIPNSAYYLYNNLPFVSTFNGGNLNFGASSVQEGWDKKYKRALAAKGITTYFVPNFSDATKYGASASSLYTSFPVADGLFSWDTAWPYASEGKVGVSSYTDEQYLKAANAARKPYMMPISTFQFKHLDAGPNNWYRRGELNFAQRISQILALKPQFVEFLTWNDGGESSYIGNVWPEAIGNSPISSYVDNFSHRGWGELITPFIKAYKSGNKIAPPAGKAAAGAFWYRTILTTATCVGDPFGKPRGWENAEDVVNVAVVLSDAGAGSTIVVYSAGVVIGRKTGVSGLNSWSLNGLKLGNVQVKVLGRGGETILSGDSPMAVRADAKVCNYNYQVVALK